MQSAHATRVYVAAVALTAAAFAVPAQAQQRLSLAERVERLEQQSARGAGTVDLVNRNQELQTQVQTLLGQIEELKFQINEMQRRSRDQYVDLDSRIGRLEGGASRAPAASVPAAGQDMQDVQLDPPYGATGSLTPEDAALVPPADAITAAAAAVADPEAEKRSYDEAFLALKDGRYAESARRFQTFIEQYPDSTLAGNAYYWLGESYYVTQNYRVALDTFATLLSRFPTNQKAPDALLKTGYCQYELKQWGEAEGTLNDVVARYPDTTVARLASGRLRALKLENRR